MVALLLTSCSHCGGPKEAGGDTPYVRCLGAGAPRAGSSRVGALSLRVHGRELRIDGLPRPTRLAAFSGPGMGPGPGPLAIAALKAARPDVILLLGDMGDTPTTAAATLAALASLPLPTLVVAGGRDTPERIESALQALRSGRERIIDVTALRGIRLGPDTLIPVAGSADGRYSLGPRACGYGLSDLKQVAGDVADLGRSRRWLVAWQAPSSTGAFGVARTSHGIDLGSPTLGELARRIDAPGGIFAWPSVQAVRAASSAGAKRAAPDQASADFQIVVPRLSGPPLERDDGSRVPPGFALLQLDDSGLRLLEAPSVVPIP